MVQGGDLGLAKETAIRVGNLAVRPEHFVHVPAAVLREIVDLGNHCINVGLFDLIQVAQLVEKGVNPITGRFRSQGPQLGRTDELVTCCRTDLHEIVLHILPLGAVVNAPAEGLLAHDQADLQFVVLVPHRRR